MVLLLSTANKPQRCGITSTRGRAARAARRLMTLITLEREVELPMRDGVRLRADVYRAANRAARPVLLQRTAYDKGRGQMASSMLDPIRAVEAGYTVVIQDTRGRYSSDGEFAPFVDEPDDGYDTVEW